MAEDGRGDVSEVVSVKVHDASKGAGAQELTGVKQPDRGLSSKGQGVRSELPEGGFASLLEAGEGADRARAGAAEREVVAGREAALEVIDAQAWGRVEADGQEQQRAQGRRTAGEQAQASADERAVAPAREEALVAVSDAPLVLEASGWGRRSEASEEARGVGGVDGARVGGEGQRVEESGATADSAKAEEVRQLAEKLVEACQTGLDQQGRQVMMLDVQVPGRGGVRVRLRRQGDGVEVRLRADNEALGDLLRARQGALRDGMAGRGVVMSRLEVVG
jgi:hypothetical protein